VISKHDLWIQNVEILVNAGVMELLRPLLIHNTRRIQQLACANLSKLAAWDVRLAESMITEGILVQLTYSLRYEVLNT
jgi:hypothetical protein